MSRSSYPQVPFPTGLQPVVIPITTLRTLIGRTIFCVSREESRYTLNGALLLLEPNKISMVATDGHRLALAQKINESGGSIPVARKLLIPGKALSDLPGLMAYPGVANIELFEDDSNFFFKIGHRLYTTRKLVGQFPNYEAVIPAGNSSFIHLSTTEFQNSLLRILQFTDGTGKVQLQLDDNAMKMSAKATDSGESEETIDAAFTSLAVGLNLNGIYLVDMCKAVGADCQIRMSVKDNAHAALFEPAVEADEVFQIVIMLMR